MMTSTGCLALLLIAVANPRVPEDRPRTCWSEAKQRLERGLADIRAQCDAGRRDGYAAVDEEACKAFSEKPAIRAQMFCKQMKRLHRPHEGLELDGISYACFWPAADLAFVVGGFVSDEGVCASIELDKVLPGPRRRSPKRGATRWNEDLKETGWAALIEEARSATNLPRHPN